MLTLSNVYFLIILMIIINIIECLDLKKIKNNVDNIFLKVVKFNDPLKKCITNKK